VEFINPLFLLTAKPVVYLINLSEKDYIRKKNKHLGKVMEWIKENAAGDPILPISICLEERLTRFETEAEVAAELKTLGVDSALPKIITTMSKGSELGKLSSQPARTRSDNGRSEMELKLLKQQVLSMVILRRRSFRLLCIISLC
jgi:ribosome-binding ATPase YchF (GTP1/OBG family)